MRKNKIKKIPPFTSESEEKAFWMLHDSTDYVDWSQGEEVSFPNLKPSTEIISLRLPQHLLARIKELANAQDVPYQSLMKIFLAEKVQEALHKTNLK